MRTAGIRRQATWHRENTLEDSQYMNTAWVKEGRKEGAGAQSCIPVSLFRVTRQEDLEAATKPLPTEGKWMVTGKTTRGITLIMFLMN